MEKEYYINIQSWMVQKLKLSGNELLTYAIVYGFSQDGESAFLGSSKYVAYALGVSRTTAIKALDGLTAKGLIIKSQDKINDIVFNRYKVSLQAIKNLDIPYTETVQGGYTETVQGGYTETVHSNKYKEINNKEINKGIVENNTTPEKKKKFTVPSIEEVQAYCTERGNNIDAQHFIDYYGARGWMLGKNHIKDWKACVRTWERNDNFKPQKKQEQPKQEEPTNFYDENGNFDVDKYNAYYGYHK